MRVAIPAEAEAKARRLGHHNDAPDRLMAVPVDAFVIEAATEVLDKIDLGMDN